jgi:phage shock protein PspC (stress-responsive transcriptional regulator)
VIVIGGVCIGIANQLNVQASAMIGQLAIAISIGIGTVLSTYWTYLVQLPATLAC